VTNYKQLRGGIEVINVIPKATSGKILRRELKKAYCEKYGIKM
jgi:acyl-coenzyme A synthetase/AMP-(fatty) acid ligase